MKNELRQNFTYVIQIAGNLLKKVAFKFPSINISFLFVFFSFCYVLATNPYTTVILLSVLILITSTVIYIKTKNYGETAFTFMLGMFTVFTLEWNIYRSVVFIGVYFTFNLIVFSIAAVRTAAESEEILTQAAGFLSNGTIKETYSRLETVVKSNTQFHFLSQNKKAEVVRFLAFRKTPIEDMLLLISYIEQLTIILSSNHEIVEDFVHSMYEVAKRNELPFNQPIFNMVYQQILELPCSPDEFFTIFKSTKSKLLLTRA